MHISQHKADYRPLSPTKFRERHRGGGGSVWPHFRALPNYHQLRLSAHSQLCSHSVTDQGQKLARDMSPTTYFGLSWTHGWGAWISRSHKCTKAQAPPSFPVCKSSSRMGPPRPNSCLPSCEAPVQLSGPHFRAWSYTRVSGTQLALRCRAPVTGQREGHEQQVRSLQSLVSEGKTCSVLQAAERGRADQGLCCSNDVLESVGLGSRRLHNCSHLHHSCLHQTSLLLILGVLEQGGRKEQILQGRLTDEVPPSCLQILVGGPKQLPGVAVEGRRLPPLCQSRGACSLSSGARCQSHGSLRGRGASSGGGCPRACCFGGSGGRCRNCQSGACRSCCGHGSC